MYQFCGFQSLYRVFSNEESKVCGPKSIQNSVLYVDFELICFVIVANLIMYSKIYFEYNFKLIIRYEKQKHHIQDFDFSVHYVVVALVQIVPKKVQIVHRVDFSGL